MTFWEKFSSFISKYNIGITGVIGSFLAGLVVLAITALLGFLSNRLVVTFIVIPAIALVTISLFAVVKISISSLTYALPPHFNQAMSMVIPSNFHLCLNIIVATEIAVWVWRWVVKFIEMYAQ